MSARRISDVLARAAYFASEFGFSPSPEFFPYVEGAKSFFR
jgi:hypothetical protein